MERVKSCRRTATCIESKQMSEFHFTAKDEHATEQLGECLAQVLPAGTVVALVGTLGAGKTRLVQAVAQALGVPRDAVTSPTFVLVNEYPGGKLPIYHFDTYRLRDEDEFIELGPEEYFDGAGITFVEWADRVLDCLPEDYVNINIEVISETCRDFVVRASSHAGEPLIEKMRSCQ